MEVEAQFGADVRVGKLLVRQFDRQADGFSAGLEGTAVRSLHDARPAARANHEAAGPRAERECPGREFVRKLARLFVIARHFEGAFRFAESRVVMLQVFFVHPAGLEVFQTAVACQGGFVRLDARGTKHHDRVADTFFFEHCQRVDIFRQNADGPGRRAAHESAVFMRSFGGMLRSEAFSIGHGANLQIKTSYDCKAASRGSGNVFGTECVERNTANKRSVIGLRDKSEQTEWFLSRRLGWYEI